MKQPVIVQQPGKNSGNGVAGADRPVRIVHVIGQLGVGGAEKQMLGLCRRMDRTRFENAVISYSLSADSLAADFRADGVTVVEFDKFSLPVRRFFLTLRRLIRDLHPDVVHTWLYSANFWGRWAAVACGVRRLVASDRCEAAPGGVVQRVSERMLAGWTLRLANSQAVARSLHDHLGVARSTIRVIYNAIDGERVVNDDCRQRVRRELGVAPDAAIVLMVGRRTREKNYPLYVRAAQRVGHRGCEACFVVVGRSTGDAGLERELESLNTEGRVRFVGQRDDVKA